MSDTLILRWRGPPALTKWKGQPQSPGPIAAIIGPKGLTGDAVPTYVHTQSSPSATWTVNHNLNRNIVVVSVRSPGGIEVTADVVFVSPNQVQIFFAAPCTGTAIVQ